MHALISVADKSDVTPFARSLVELGWTILSSGGTSRALAEGGVPHDRIEDTIAGADIVGGRVRSLHVQIYAAILADPAADDHRAQLDALGATVLDMIVVNLPPLAPSDNRELIDVGGPTMIRAALKRSDRVTLATNPADYAGILADLRSHGEVPAERRRTLAATALRHARAYDECVAEWIEAPPS